MHTGFAKRATAFYIPHDVRLQLMRPVSANGREKGPRVMNFRNRVLASALGLAMVMLMGQVPLVAQEGGAPAPTDSTKTRTFDPARRVPRYFGQVGLTPEQKESIYKIVGKHQQKIDALQKQLADEKAAAIKECEGVLNDQQKQMLDVRRKAAPTRQPSGPSSAKAPAPAPGGSSN